MHSASLLNFRHARRFAGAAVLIALAPLATAQDKATLDLLVKKNLITQSEADSIAKPAAVVTVTPKESLVKGLKLEGLIQEQYDWISTDDKRPSSSNPPAESQFLLRRAYLGALADLGNGWGGELVVDFAVGAGQPGAPQNAGATANAVGSTGNNANNLFEKIVITKDIDQYGRFTAGYRKVNFTLEEYTSTAVLKVIERSIASRYFDEAYTATTNGRIGFANRHNGLYWDGKVSDVPGLTYGAAITTGIQNSSGYTPVGGFNKFGGWGYIAYANKYSDLDYSFGLNLGYSADGNSNPGPGATPVTQSASNSVWGYNPWVKLAYQKKAEVTAEFIQTQIQNGRFNNPGAAGTSTATPYGFSITPSYRINDQWEIAARYSYLSTNGRGVQVSQVIRNGNNPLPVGGLTPQFNNVQSIYLGVNWYIIGDAVKVQAGYEWSQFLDRGNTATTAAGGTDSFTGPKANVNGFRARLQLVF